MRKLLILAAAALAAGCSRDEAPAPVLTAPAADTETLAPEVREISVTGEVEWPAGIDLPENAFLRVTLSDVSRQDASSAPLAEEKYPVDQGSPVAFALTADSEIDPRALLSISAQISDGAALFYTSDTSNPVPAAEGAKDLSITLVPVEAAPGTGAGGAPVSPVPVAYQCGDELVEIAVEAGAAYVTGSGGETVKLTKLSGGEAAPQTFTKGRLTVFFDGSDMDGLSLRLSRGKAAAMDCVAAP
jgi:uncharacterized lipoprotein YbaY